MNQPFNTRNDNAINASELQSIPISNVAPTNGQILSYVSSTLNLVWTTISSILPANVLTTTNVATVTNKIMGAFGLSGNITPSVDSTYSLGSSSSAMQLVYTQFISGNASGQLAIVSQNNQNITIAPNGSGNITCGSPLFLTAGSSGLGNFTVTTYTSVFTGPFTSGSITITLIAVLDNSGHGTVTIDVPNITGVSTVGTIMTASTAMASTYIPKNATKNWDCRIENSGASPTVAGMFQINSSGIIIISLDLNNSNFANSGTCGLLNGFSTSYAV